ncbi:hypothetical protein MP228_011515 [Amoeboaphelidium protococcarum]|nr:hypothetical protein MP228_011515 [Amoeboaphelidium protococcarum]
MQLDDRRFINLLHQLMLRPRVPGVYQDSVAQMILDNFRKDSSVNDKLMTMRILVRSLDIGGISHETALLSINCLQNLLTDDNALLRLHALKTLTQLAIHIPELCPIVVLCIRQKCIVDQRASIRQQCGESLLALYSSKNETDSISEQVILDIIKLLLKDRNLNVFAQGLRCFMEVCPYQFDLVHGYYYRCCIQIIDMQPWDQISTLDFLQHYCRNTMELYKSSIDTQQSSDQIHTAQSESRSQAVIQSIDDMMQEQTVQSQMKLMMNSLWLLLHSKNKAVCLKSMELIYNCSDMHQLLLPRILSLLQNQKSNYQQLAASLLYDMVMNQSIFLTLEQLRSLLYQYVLNKMQPRVESIVVQVIKHCGSKDFIEQILRQDCVPILKLLHPLHTMKMLDMIRAIFDCSPQFCLQLLLSVIDIARDVSIREHSIIFVLENFDSIASERRDEICRRLLIASIESESQNESLLSSVLNVCASYLVNAQVCALYCELLLFQWQKWNLTLKQQLIISISALQDGDGSKFNVNLLLRLIKLINSESSYHKSLLIQQLQAIQKFPKLGATQCLYIVQQPELVMQEVVGYKFESLLFSDSKCERSSLKMDPWTKSPVDPSVRSASHDFVRNLVINPPSAPNSRQASPVLVRADQPQDSDIYQDLEDFLADSNNPGQQAVDIEDQEEMERLSDGDDGEEYDDGDLQDEREQLIV